MQNPFLIGDHIYLRPLEKADAPTLMPWFNDPETTRFLIRHSPINLRAEEEFIDGLYRNDEKIVLGIVLKDSDRLIGGVGLHDIHSRNRSAGFGITIGVNEERGKGHGTEATRLLLRYAFETLNLNRVWLHVYEFNERGLRVYEKVGFKKEGVLRQHRFHDGRYWDTIVMGILREEFALR